MLTLYSNESNLWWYSYNEKLTFEYESKNIVKNRKEWGDQQEYDADRIPYRWKFGCRDPILEKCPSLRKRCFHALAAQEKRKHLDSKIDIMSRAPKIELHTESTLFRHTSVVMRDHSIWALVGRRLKTTLPPQCALGETLLIKLFLILSNCLLSNCILFYPYWMWHLFASCNWCNRVSHTILRHIFASCESPQYLCLSL